MAYLTADIASVPSFDRMRIIVPNPGQASVYLTASGAQGEFLWDSASVLDDDDTDIIKPTAVSGAGRWIRNSKPGYSPVWGQTLACTLDPSSMSTTRAPQGAQVFTMPNGVKYIFTLQRVNGNAPNAGCRIAQYALPAIGTDPAPTVPTTASSGIFGNGHQGLGLFMLGGQLYGVSSGNSLTGVSDDDHYKGFNLIGPLTAVNGSTVLSAVPQVTTYTLWNNQNSGLYGEQYCHAVATCDESGSTLCIAANSIDPYNGSHSYDQTQWALYYDLQAIITSYGITGAFVDATEVEPIAKQQFTRPEGLQADNFQDFALSTVWGTGLIAGQTPYRGRRTIQIYPKYGSGVTTPLQIQFDGSAGLYPRSTILGNDLTLQVPSSSECEGLAFDGPNLVAVVMDNFRAYNSVVEWASSDVAGNSIATASWSGGVVTLTLNQTAPWAVGPGTHRILVNGFVGSSIPTGYNGYQTATVTSNGTTSTITYPLVNDPGTATTIGTYKPSNYYAYIGTDPSSGNLPSNQSFWALVQGSGVPSATIWDSGTTYTAGANTQIHQNVYLIGPYVGSSRQTPIERDVTNPLSPAVYPIAGEGKAAFSTGFGFAERHISFDLGEGFGGTVRDTFNYDGTDQFNIHSNDPTADNSKYVQVEVLFAGTRERLGLYAKNGSTSTGAALFLYGNNDSVVPGGAIVNVASTNVTSWLQPGVLVHTLNGQTPTVLTNIQSSGGSPSTPAIQVQGNSLSSSSIGLNETVDSNSSAPVLFFTKQRATAPHTLLSGDTLGTLVFNAFDGTNYIPSFALKVLSTQNTAAGLSGGYLSIQGANNTATASEFASFHPQGYMKLTPVALSALGSASTAGAGSIACISDATAAPAPTNYGNTVTGGSSHFAKVTSDGTNWIYG